MYPFFKFWTKILRFVKRRYFLLFLLSAQVCVAQKSGIYGSVKDGKTEEPIVFAHIFIANTTRGTTSDTNGQFNLEDTPDGKFTLVCTMVGYEPYIKEIDLLQGKQIELIIELNASVNILNEIELIDKEDKKWKRKFEKFKRELLGDTPNAEYCEIINPWIVDFSENRLKRIFKAHADQPLIIQNNALGYKITFLMIRYEKEADRLYYLGYPSFENLKITDLDSIERFTENREETYKGSLRHFFYALVNDRLEDEGFVLYKIAQGYENNVFQSVKGALNEHLFLPVDISKVVDDSNPWGYYTVYTSNALEVIYTGKMWDNSPYWDARYQVSRIWMDEKIMVTKSGYIFNPYSFIVFGFLSEERLANMLPFEYRYDKKN